MLQQLFDLSGRVALVTGASRGLGQYMARALARAGADIAITSRDQARLAETEEDILDIGRRVLSVELDVLNLSSIQSAVQDVEAHFGRLDVLVNNAGCNVRRRALEVTAEDWDTVVNTNLRGAFFVAQAAARIMKAQHWGRVINIGSVTCYPGQVRCGLCRDGALLRKPGWYKAAYDVVGP